MLTISKPLSAGAGAALSRGRVSATRARTTTRRATQIRGEWHGALAERVGPLGCGQRSALSAARGGRITRSPASRSCATRAACTYTNDRRRVGEDDGASRGLGRDVLGAEERVAHGARRRRRPRPRGASRRASRSRSTNRSGTSKPGWAAIFRRETTGHWVAAPFEHDSARPVDGYAAPQLHTHVVFFNVTQTDERDVRPLQPRELYRTQQYATAVYRSELASRLNRPRLRDRARREWISRKFAATRSAYLEASSPRRQQIEEHLRSRHQQRRRRGANCGTSDARSQARLVTRGDASPSSRAGGRVRRSTRCTWCARRMNERCG